MGDLRPRILVYGAVRPPEIGCGISSAIRAFAASRIRTAHQVEVISTFRAPRDRSIVERLAFGVWRATATAITIVKSGAALADIHTASDRSLLSHAAILFGARLVGCPALLRIHGGNFQKVFEQASGIQRAVIRLILRTATRVVVLSTSWRERIAAIEPRAAIEVIPNPVDCAAYVRLSDRPERPYRKILFLANLCEMKGHYDALEALARIVPSFPDLLLMLAGEDRETGTRVELERRAQAAGISSNIVFLGTVSGAAKDQAFRDADILILPSHVENMPISIIEGMAAALPVVATRVGAVSEMIIDGYTGFLVEPHNPAALAERIMKLMGDEKMARAMGRNAQLYACATWDADVVAEKNIDIYRRLIGNG